MKKIQITPLEKPVKSKVSIPGSKSYTNRALLLAALTKGTVKIKNALFSEDTEAMMGCLEGFGIFIEKDKDVITVKGNIEDILEDEYKLNAKLSGTTIRFISAFSCIVPGVKIISGEDGLNKRPIGELVNALRQLGANIEYLDKEGFPPIKINSSKLFPGKVTILGQISSQFLSSILMISPLIGDVEIITNGEQISKPYIDMTLDIMEQFGVKVKNKEYKKYSISLGQKYFSAEYLVEGDFSSAAYFFAIAALTSSTISCNNLSPNSKQADKRFLEILKQMGNIVYINNNEITVDGNGVKPIEVNMESYPDQAQTLAVLAAFGKGVSKITGIKSLRIKETERIKALQNELGKMGIKTITDANSITIFGGVPKQSEIDTYNDHRMAMSFAVAGTVLKGMVINNPEVVNKTFPDFWKKLETIGVRLK